MLTKKVDFAKYKRKIDKPFNKLMAETLKTGITSRTQSGKDVDSKTFKEYTPAYRAKKGSSKVNLTVSNNMLHAMKYEINGSTLRFYYTGNEGKKAHGNQVKNGRKFFGLDKKQIAMLKKKIGDVIVNQ